MVQRVVRAEYIDGFVVTVAFSDGAEGEIDLRDDLEGEVFGPLRDPQYFRQFRLDKELHTLVWPNGADFAPEFLYERIKVKV
jgi:hypothetical protein